MQRKILVLVLGIVMLIGIFSTASLATTRNNGLTEEKVQTMVDEKVQSAVSGAVSEMQANIEAKNSQNEEKSEEENKQNGLGMIAAAIATGLACIGSGIAVAIVASSAVGAISENPSLLGKTIIFAGLAEGIAIYGLIISIMILNKI